MPLRDFRDVVDQLNKDGLTIVKGHLIKFGTITVSAFESSDDMAYPYSAHQDKVDKSPSIYEADIDKEICEALKKHPNVFNFKIDNKEDSTSFFGPEGVFLVRGSTYTLDVHLPKAKQIYQDMDCEEHFSVIGAGTYFATYAEIKSLPPYSNMGHEFREMFKSQIESATKWKSHAIGPCPIHSDIVILESNKKEPSSEDKIARLYISNRNLFAVVEAGKADIAIKQIIRECFLYLSLFYELKLIRSSLLNLDVELQNRMETLMRAYSESMKFPFWRFKTVNDYLSIAREELAKIYELRLTHSRDSLQYTEHRKHFLDTLSRSRTLSKLGRNFKSDTVLDAVLPDSFVSSLQFFQQQADLRRSFYTPLLASLVGALIGGLFTALVTLLKH